jgi:hypothetical protein
MPKDSRPLKDIAVGIFMLAVSAVVFWATLALPDSEYEPLGPAPVPRGVAVAIAICAAIILVQGLRGLRAGAGAPPEPLEYTPRPGLALITVVLTVLYVGSMAWGLASFRNATVVFLLLLGAILTRFEPRRLPAIVAIALVLGFGAQYIFTRVLIVDLP